MSKGQEREKGGKNKRKKREREKSEKKQERKESGITKGNILEVKNDKNSIIMSRKVKAFA